MALFPKVEFDILVTGGAIVPGRRTDAILVVTTAHEIPRAEHIVVTLRSTLFLAAPPSPELRREIFFQNLRLELPDGLDAGTHRLPFALDAPAWLPPGFSGVGIAVAHDVDARLDIAWSIVAPHAAIRAVVEPPSKEGKRTPLRTRTPRDFHPSIILEVTLDSVVIAHGMPVLGTVRVVGGGEREIDGVELSLASFVTPLGGRNEPRRSLVDSRVFVDGRGLEGRRAAPFEVPFPPFTPPSFDNAFVRHEVALEVRLIRARVPPRSFSIPIEVLPKGSIIDSNSPLPLDHLRKWGIAISNVTDLLPGTGNCIAHGQVGPILLRIREAPRHLRTGLDIEYEVPDEPLAPPEHVPIADDDEAAVASAARRAVENAKAMVRAISAQPFPPDMPLSAQESWRAAAIDAFLIPSAPTIHGLVFPLRPLGNEERWVPVHIRTIPQGHLRITLDLRGMPLPESAIGPLQNGQIPRTSVSTNGDTLTLVHPSWPSDPRTLYPEIERLLDWALAARGERRAIAAYR